MWLSINGWRCDINYEVYRFILLLFYWNFIGDVVCTSTLVSIRSERFTQINISCLCLCVWKFWNWPFWMVVDKIQANRITLTVCVYMKLFNDALNAYLLICHGVFYSVQFLIYANKYAQISFYRVDESLSLFYTEDSLTYRRLSI